MKKWRLGGAGKKEIQGLRSDCRVDPRWVVKCGKLETRAAWMRATKCCKATRKDVMPVARADTDRRNSVITQPKIRPR